MKQRFIFLTALIVALTTIANAQMRTYVDMFSKSAYVVSSQKLDKVTFFSNGKPVMTFYETNSLGVELPRRVFEKNLSSAKFGSWKVPGDFMYSFNYNANKEEPNYNFWELTVAVEWTMDRTTHDTLFSPCCPSNIVYITTDDIEDAKERNVLEARAARLEWKLRSWGLVLDWSGYNSNYFRIKRGNDSLPELLSFYIHNKLVVSENDSTVIITGLPYHNYCKENKPEDESLFLRFNGKPIGSDIRSVKENSFVLTIRKNKEAVVSTKTLNGKEETFKVDLKI